MERNRSYHDSNFLLTVGLVSAILAMGSVKFLRLDYLRYATNKQAVETQKTQSDLTTGAAER
jgi:hypothetical protein